MHVFSLKERETKHAYKSKREEAPRLTSDLAVQRD